MPEFTGKVVSNALISLRFAEGGKLNSIKCHPRQIVKRRDLLASLDPKPIQTQLDIELADFRRTRAEFDQLTRQIPIAKTEDEKTKKEIAQSKLDVSIKTVEKYKLQLDGLNLLSPTDAVIINSDGLLEGINITPSGFPIILAPLDSAVFECLVNEDNFYQLRPDQKAKISLKNGFSIDSEVIYLSPESIGNDNTFAVWFKLPRMNLTNFRIGTSGKVSL